MRGFIPVPVIILILALTAIPVGYFGYKFILSSSAAPAPATTRIPPLLTQKTASKSAAAKTPTTPAPTASLITPSTAPATAPAVTAVNGWTVTGSSSVNIIPTFTASRKELYLDFESANFSGVTSVEYNLTYEIATSTTLKAISGSFNPTAVQITGTRGTKQYVRRIITLGTCSQSVCSYDSDPHNFTLTVTIDSTDSPTLETKILTRKTLF